MRLNHTKFPLVVAAAVSIALLVGCTSESPEVVGGTTESTAAANEQPGIPSNDALAGPSIRTGADWVQILGLRPGITAPLTGQGTGPIVAATVPHETHHERRADEVPLRLRGGELVDCGRPSASWRNGVESSGKSLPQSNSGTSFSALPKDFTCPYSIGARFSDGEEHSSPRRCSTRSSIRINKLAVCTASAASATLS